MRFLLLFLFSTTVLAQEWPSKPIRWLVPFAPGGPADVVARIVAAGLAERTGQPNVVENQAGASGNIAHAAASKSAADGHTLVFVVPAVITNPFYLKTSVDPFRDLAPVIHLDNASMVLIANPAFPPSTFQETLSFIKANPGKVTCGASGALPSVGCESTGIKVKALAVRLLDDQGRGSSMNIVRALEHARSVGAGVCAEIGE